MTESRPSEIGPIRSSGTPKVEKIRFLREGIKQRLPEARRIQAKSGIAPETPSAKRLAINEAGNMLRADIRYELKKDIDSLTGALNETGFTNRLTEETGRAGRGNYELSLVYLDANNLKEINDSLGHAAGTEYIKKIAGILQAGTRQNTDSVARWGGDEFAVIMPHTSLEGAREWWKQISQEFKKNNVSIGAGASVIVPEDITSAEQVISTIEAAKKLVDKALYVAKPLSKMTRDCIMITTADLSQEELRAA